MFSTSANLPNGDANNNNNNNNQEGGDNASASGAGGGGETRNPWGAGGPNGNNRGDGKAGNWQGSSSLSWLTNLRKGIMSGGASSLLLVVVPVCDVCFLSALLLL